MILVDLIIIGVILLCTFLGYKKGLIGVAFKILSFLIAIIISLILYIPISNFVINNTQIDEIIKDTIIENMAEDNEQEDIESNMPKTINNYIEKYTKDAKNASIEVAAENISITLVRLMVSILLFIVIRIILMFIKAIASLVENIPIIKQFNGIGGIIYGLLQSLFIIFIVFAIISVVSPMINTSGVLTAINDSFIGSILYNNNIILKLIF